MSLSSDITTTGDAIDLDAAVTLGDDYNIPYTINYIDQPTYRRAATDLCKAVNAMEPRTLDAFRFPIFFKVMPRPHPAIVCNTMWALTDFTEANGATRIVPGSHLMGRQPPGTVPPPR